MCERERENMHPKIGEKRDCAAFVNKNVEEVLYSAMEDYKLDIIIGEGPAARAIKIDLPKSVTCTFTFAKIRKNLLIKIWRGKIPVVHSRSNKGYDRKY